MKKVISVLLVVIMLAAVACSAYVYSLYSAEKTMNAELNETIKTHEAAIEDLNKAAEETKAAGEEALETVNAQLADAEKAAEEAKAAYEAQIEALNAQIETMTSEALQMTEASAKAQAESEQAQMDLADQIKALEGEKETLNAAHEETVRQYDAQIADLTKQLNELNDAYVKDVENLNKAAAEAEKKHAEEIAGLVSEHEAAYEKAEKRLKQQPKR